MANTAKFGLANESTSISTARAAPSREISGIIKTITVKRDALGDLYLFFSCELPDIQAITQSNTSAGFDFGLKTFLTSSEGEEILNPEFHKVGLTSIKKANRQVSRKVKGSHNRAKAKANYARTHKRVANQRRDYHFKLAKELSQKYQSLFFEDLNMRGMKKLWGRKVSDLGFSEFMRILEYQCSRTGAVVHKIDRFFPSTKMCSECGTLNQDLELKIREWDCSHCSSHHQRDLNAAINIKREGASSLGVGSVRLAQAS